MKRVLPAAAASLAILAFGCSDGQSQADGRATATVSDRDGNELVTVDLAETPNGVHLSARFTGAPEGVHGFHVHETGACGGDFTSAGGHFNPDGRAHGFAVEGGPHLGDMPNVHLPASGALTVEYFLPEVALSADAATTLFDEDGSAIVLHAGADDYRSQPSGAAGARIGCGVIERK